MTCNMATVDRLLRAILVAPSLLGVAYGFGSATEGWIVLIALAAVMLATAAVGSCSIQRLAPIEARHQRRSTMKAGTSAHRWRGKAIAEGTDEMSSLPAQTSQGDRRNRCKGAEGATDSS